MGQSGSRPARHVTVKLLVLIPPSMFVELFPDLIYHVSLCQDYASCSDRWGFCFFLFRYWEIFEIFFNLFHLQVNVVSLLSVPFNLGFNHTLSQPRRKQEPVHWLFCSSY